MSTIQFVHYAGDRTRADQILAKLGEQPDVQVIDKRLRDGTREIVVLDGMLDHETHGRANVEGRLGAIDSDWQSALNLR